MKSKFLHLVSAQLLVSAAVILSLHANESVTETLTDTQVSQANNLSSKLYGVMLSVPNHLCRNVNDDQAPTDTTNYEKWDRDHVSSPAEKNIKAVTLTAKAGPGGGVLTLEIKKGATKITCPVEGHKDTIYWKEMIKEKRYPIESDDPQPVDASDHSSLTWNLDSGEIFNEVFYIEGVENSDEKNDIQFVATHVTEGASPSVPKATTVYEVDMDVDSYNNNGFADTGYDAAAPEGEAATEDEIEASEKLIDGVPRPGKIVIGSHYADNDGDAIPDFADLKIKDHQFVPVKVTLNKAFYYDNTTVQFDYLVSKPENSVNGYTITQSQQQGVSPTYTLNKGGMRIWRKDAPDRKAEDFISTDGVYLWSELAGEGKDSVTLYIEYVDKAIPVASGRKEIKVKATEGNVECTDKVVVSLLPVDLITDTNNDGEITDSDNLPRVAAYASDASEAIRDEGTEFIFHNDQLSNGIWDKEDSDPAKPANEKDDDDAEQILIKPRIAEGDVWLEHPAIAGLSFYKTRECKAVDKVNLSPTSRFKISSSNPFPDELFMRVDGTLTYSELNPQFEGDLVLKIKTGSNGQEVEAAKLKLTVIKAVGAKKYFHAARDYMFENNSKLCARNESIEWVSARGSNVVSAKQIVMMLHENTTMKAVETFHRNPMLWGIGAVVNAYPTYDLAVNGNYCFKSRLRSYPFPNGMTEMCHGRLIAGSADSPSSATGGDSPFESAQADYIAFKAEDGINIKTGIVPLQNYEEALGGCASKLENYGWHPWYGIGEVNTKKIFFVATPRNNNSGGGAKFKQQLKDSGVPALPGGEPGEIQCIAGDGGSSLALAYRLDVNPLKVYIAGAKHFKTPPSEYLQQGNYFINTYLAFKTEKPR